MFLGSRLPTSAPIGEIIAMGEQLQDFPKVRIILHGAVADYMVVGRATRIKYGYHKAGDVLWVHPNDQAADPEVMVLAGEENAQAPNVPIFPGDVRPPETPEARKAFKSLTPEEPFQETPKAEEPASDSTPEASAAAPEQPAETPIEVINTDAPTPEGITEVQPEEKASDAPEDSQPS